MRLLIDGDILVYRCAFAAESTEYVLAGKEGVFAGPFPSAKVRNEYIKEHSIDLGDEVQIGTLKTVEPVSHALENIKSVMGRIIDALKSDDFMVALSSGGNFREDVATIKKYKGNRDDAPRPVYYQECRDYLCKYYNARIYEAVEADDVLALCQNDKSVIVSIDKDLLQVPGLHFNWVKYAQTEGKDGKIRVSEEVGLRKLYQQVLTGDSTDNIPGVWGIGEKKVRQLLADIPATKKDLSDFCTATWDEFLASPKGESLGFICQGANNDGERMYTYSPWYAEGNSELDITTTAQGIAAEVYQLVKVGGDHVAQIAEEAGEEIPYA